MLNNIYKIECYIYCKIELTHDMGVILCQKGCSRNVIHILHYVVPYGSVAGAQHLVSSCHCWFLCVWCAEKEKGPTKEME